MIKDDKIKMMAPAYLTNPPWKTLLNRTKISKDTRTIMEFLGYDLVEVSYFGADEAVWQVENREWMDEVELHSVGIYFVDMLGHTFVSTNDLSEFSTGWKYLVFALIALDTKGKLPEFTPYLADMEKRTAKTIRSFGVIL